MGERCLVLSTLWEEELRCWDARLPVSFWEACKQVDKGVTLYWDNIFKFQGDSNKPHMSWAELSWQVVLAPLHPFWAENETI